MKDLTSRREKESSATCLYLDAAKTDGNVVDSCQEGDWFDDIDNLETITSFCR